METRIDQEKMQRRQISPFELLPPAPGQGRALQYEKGHIGTKAGSHLHESAVRKPDSGHLIQGHKDGSGVRTATSEAGADGYDLFHGYLDAPSDSRALEKNTGSLVGKVVLASGSLNGIRNDGNTLALRDAYDKLVKQGYGLHESRDLMIAVSALSKHPQEQIHLCGRLEGPFHFHLLWDNRFRSVRSSSASAYSPGLVTR